MAVVPATNTVAAEPQALVANGKLIRDARLDSYLAAHKQFAGTSALGVPSGFLRSATVAHFVPRRSGDRPQALSPRVIAAVARHRRP